MAQRDPLNIAVVGHTNTGKTSLLRTLTRDTQFGVVDNAPGTTRQVAGAAHWLHDAIALVWFDTPGLEDSVALFDWVESPEPLAPSNISFSQPSVRFPEPQTPVASPGSTRLDGPQKIQRFLESPSARNRFEQEARVLEKVLASDAALYVIDARDPVLAKHRDELSLLSSCAKPVIAVLNFTAPTLEGRTSNVDEWLNALARQALHVHVLFDTVSPALDAERDLFEALAQVLPKHRSLFTDLIEQTQVARHARRMRAFELIANMMIDLAAWRLQTANHDDARLKAQDTQQTRTRAREQQCVDGLLLTYAFNRHDVLNMPLAMTEGRWQTDLFAPEALREVGIELSKGAAAGALAGAAVDLITGGLSLGAGTLIGAATGAGWQGFDRWGGRLLGRVRGYRELTLDDSILKLLAIRQLQLLQALDQRGHAAVAPVSVQNLSNNEPIHASDRLETDMATPAHSVIATQTKIFSQSIRLARQHPEWSSLQGTSNTSAARDQVVDALTDTFESNAQLN
jgi:GTPase Era involved in 16S rRNA processing